MTAEKSAGEAVQETPSPEPKSLGAREKYRQKRRGPRPERAADDLRGSDALEEVFDLIPEIGEGYRWYDRPYRVLTWLGSGWRTKILPRKVREIVSSRINYLIPYNEYDRDKAWPLDELHHNIFVPEDEHVAVAGIWAIELFPPAELHAFERALRKNGWQRRQRWNPHDDGNATELERSRTGAGASWWRVVDLLRKDSKWFVPDGIRTDLPSTFEAVHLRAIQVGAGLTAVVAEFALTKDAARSIDAEWHRDHEPMLLAGKAGGRRRSLDRQWAAFWLTQSKRRELHTSAREWLSKMVPGFFSIGGAPQPVFDLLLFDQFDPMMELQADLSHEERVKQHDALRALGVSERGFDHITSRHLPKVVLSAPDSRMHEALGDMPTWTLWGNTGAIIEALGDRANLGPGVTAERVVAHRVESAYNMFVMLSVSEFLHISTKRYAAIRDSASVKHGKFKPTVLKELRKNLLTLSLNIATVRRDVEEFWESPAWKWSGGAIFKYVATPEAKFWDEKEGRKTRKPTSFNKAVRQGQKERFSQLAKADQDYRDILSTVASLGASADAFKIGRWALFVAIVSLIVALGTILLADIGCASIVHEIVGWPPAMQC